MIEKKAVSGSPLVDLAVAKVLDGYDINKVHKKIQDRVREEIENNRGKYIEYYVIRVLSGAYLIDSVPSTIREEVRTKTDVVESEGLATLYIARILDEQITIEDVPESYREKVQRDLEALIGKKLDSGE